MSRASFAGHEDIDTQSGQRDGDLCGPTVHVFVSGRSRGKAGFVIFVDVFACSCERWFHDITKVLDLENSCISLHFLRRGGTTFDFLDHGSMEKTVLRGRSASSAAARVYLVDAVAHLADLRLNDGQTNFVRGVAALAKTWSKSQRR